MALSRRSFVRAAGLSTVGLWSTPWRSATQSEGLLNVFRRHDAPAPGSLLLCYNENPVGPGAAVLDAVQNGLGVVSRYPFNPVGQLRLTLLRYLNLPAEEPPPGPGRVPAKTRLMLGVGSTEVLRSCISAFTGPDRAFVAASPTFDVPVAYANDMHVPVRTVPVDGHLRLDLAAMLDQVQGAGMVYICNPNNPTATVHDAKTVGDFIDQVNARAPGCMIVVDEAYLDYADEPSKLTALPIALSNPSVIVTRTFSKAFGMAGLRLGYAVGHPDAIARLQLQHLTAGENVISMIAGATALEQAPTHIVDESRRNREAREFTRRAFEEMGYKTEPSATNFIFVPVHRDAAVFAAACARQGVLIGRSFPPLTTYARITIGTMDDMKKAVEVFKSALATV